jgi:hypothetical protein
MLKDTCKAGRFFTAPHAVSLSFAGLAYHWPEYEIIVDLRPREICRRWAGLVRIP